MKISNYISFIVFYISIATNVYSQNASIETSNKNAVQSIITYNDGTKSKESFQFFDGLGRNTHTVNKDFALNNNIIIESAIYDNLGRVSQQSYLANNKLKTLIYEPSYLNRINKEVYPDGSEIELNYDRNLVQKDFAGVIYPVNSLFKSTVIDENDNASITYKDKIGRLVGVENAIGGITQYKYFDHGGVEKIISPDLQEYLYTYNDIYLIESKTMPGAGTTYYTYDNRDLQLTSWDANGNKIIFQYDVYGRLEYQYLVENALNQFMSPSELVEDNLLLQNYYDDNCPGTFGLPCQNNSDAILKGKLVASRTRLLNASSTPEFIYQVLHYDEHGRIKETHTITHDGKVDMVANEYNDADQVITQNRIFNGHTLDYNHSYDTWDRNVTSNLNVDLTGHQRLFTNKYNLEGLLAEKYLGPNLQSIDYDYNSRGWLRRMNQSLAPFQYGNKLQDCAILPNVENDTDIVDVIDNYTVTLDQLLNMRFNIELSSSEYEQCFPAECPDPPSCDPIALIAQQLEIETVLDNTLMDITEEVIVECEVGGNITSQIQDQVNLEQVQLPITVYRIRICNGQEFYVLAQYMSQFTTDQFYLQQTIEITSYEQTFIVLLEGQQVEVDLARFLELLLVNQSYTTGTEINVDNYVECGSEECETEFFGCSAEEVLLTEQALLRLQNNAPLKQVNNIPLPITLYFIRLCDGQTLWVLQEELIDIGAAPYEILDELIINDLTDPIEVEDAIDKVDKNDLFCMQLDYESSGNIKRQLSQVAGKSLFKYEYEYDNIDRLNDATFSEHFSLNGQALKSLDNRFGVNNIQYSPDGNILHLERKGINGYCSNGFADFGNIDHLDYTYNEPGQANRLSSVTDATSSPYGFAGLPGSNYTYDSNGNLKSDPYKGISGIIYNHLNLPKQIVGASNQIDYLYDALGVKWQKLSGGTTTDYYGGIEYKDDALEAIYHNDGRIVPKDGGGYEFEYSIKDHLGNSRVTFVDKDENGKISINEDDDELLQEQHYYPFGMSYESSSQSPWHRYPTADKDSKYLYNGKEVQSEVFRSVGSVDVELGLYDYGARYYDPAIGRFTSVDPLAEMYNYQTSYAYAANNPVSNIDIFGMAAASTSDLIDKVWAQGNGTYDNDGNKKSDGIETEYKHGDKSITIDDGIDKVIEVDEAGFNRAQAFASIIDRERSEGGVKYYTEREYLKFASENNVQSFLDYLLDGGPSLIQLDIGTPPDLGAGKVLKIAGAARTLSKRAKGAQTLTKRIKEHLDKLINYRSNPEAYDNLGKLKNVTKEVWDTRVQGRIKKLQREIRKFVRERKKLSDG